MDQDLFFYLETKSMCGRGGMNNEFGLETETKPSVAYINIYQHLEIHIDNFR